MNTKTYVGIIPGQHHYSVAWHPSGHILDFEVSKIGEEQLVKALHAQRPELIVIVGIRHPLSEILRSAGFHVQTAAPYQIPQIAHVAESEPITALHVALVASRVRISGLDFDPKNPRPGLAELWPPFPQFDVPVDSELVWRYMDMGKLVSLLESKSLFLPSARQFKDVFEGSYPLKNSASQVAKETGQDMNAIIQEREKLRDWVCVSCWHLSEVESAALWEIYGRNESSIAVRSNFGALRDSVNAEGVHGGLFFARVRYLDYENESIPGQISSFDISPFFYKRKSFEFERELRIIAVGPKPFNLPVDLGCLVQAVYVAPGAQQWFEDAIRSLLARYGLGQVQVRRSDLSKDPIY